MSLQKKSVNLLWIFSQLMMRVPTISRSLSSQSNNNMAFDFDGIAKAFVSHYYTTFDGNRANLGSLYQDNSMLTFEGERFQGRDNIVKKIVV